MTERHRVVNEVEKTPPWDTETGSADITSAAGDGARPRLARDLLTHRQGAVGAAIILGLVLMAVLAPLLSPFDPQHVDVENILNPPSATHWLGTDELGRDIASRIIFGTRVTLQVAAGAVALSLVTGVILGFVAAYSGRFWDALIMRVIDALLAIPPLIFALAIVAALGPNLFYTILAIALAKLGMFARLADRKSVV